MKKKSVLSIMLSIILLFMLSSFFSVVAYGKYISEISVGKFDLIIMPTSREYLIEGNKFNKLMPKRTTEIKFDTYINFPQFKGNGGGTNAAVDDNNIENDNIKIFTLGTVVYVLSDSLIFANPNSSGMFKELKNLKSIEFNNFSTEYVINAQYMFFGCQSLTTLDISCFDTKNVTDMSSMFLNCKSLNSIYASNKWSTVSVAKSNYMFYNCKRLRGGKGTTYSWSNRNSHIYAKIDEGRRAPGYFTEKNSG